MRNHTHTQPIMYYYILLLEILLGEREPQRNEPLFTGALLHLSILEYIEVKIIASTEAKCFLGSRDFSLQ